MFLRHSSRHVHHTVAAHIEAGLTQLGWTDPDVSLRPFGAPQVRFQRTAPITGGTLDPKITAGLVSITLGDEFDAELEELGGPLSRQEIPVFVDVFMDTDATTTALALDVRDILMGRFEFSPRRAIPVTDQVLRTDVPGWRIEFEDIERVRPDAKFALFWQVVKVTAATYFQEVVY